MEYKRFSLGLRFAMTNDAALTPERVWETLFQRVPAETARGLMLFGVMDAANGIEPEPAYACVFSGLSNKRAKALYLALFADRVLCSFLTAYQPFIQNNRIEKCGEPTYLGTVGENGALMHGDASFANMRFCGKVRQAHSGKAPRLLVVTEAMGNVYSASDAARRIMRAAAQAFPDAGIRVQRISDGGGGTLDAVIAAVRGRYLVCKETGVRYGVLPDRTVLLETELLTDEQARQTMRCAAEEGYSSFLLAAGKRRLAIPFDENFDVTILSNPVLDEVPENPRVRYASGVETILHTSNFSHLLQEADRVVLGTRARDDTCELLGATADTVRYHCTRRGIPFDILALHAKDRYSIRTQGYTARTLVDTTLDAAAAALFAEMQPAEEGRF